MSDPMSTPTGPTRPPPLDLAACEELMRGGSKSFFAASSLLPQHVRMPSIALYAFCRVADDAIDENTDDPLAMDKLRARLDAIYAGEPGEIIEDRAMAMVVHRVNCRKPCSRALRGMRRVVTMKHWTICTTTARGWPVAWAR